MEAVLMYSAPANGVVSRDTSSFTTRDGSGSTQALQPVMQNYELRRLKELTEARQGPQWRRASLSPIRPSHFSEANAGAYARAAQLCGRNAHGTPVSKKLLKTSLRKTEKECVQEHATSRKNRCTSTQENSEYVVEQKFGFPTKIRFCNKMLSLHFCRTLTIWKLRRRKI